jgi:signal transduction histidine kinase
MGVVSISKNQPLPELSTEPFSEQGVALLSKPDVLADLLSACLDHATPQVVVDIILQDAPFAAQLIEVATRASSHPLDPREPVTAAVNSLGYPLIISLALQAARRVLEHKLSPAEVVFLQKLWCASRFAGQAARCIAPSVNYPYIEEAQLAGLLQNIGLYQLFIAHGGCFLEHDPFPWSSEEQIVWEREQFGADHLEIAARKIESWKLDSFLAATVDFLTMPDSQLQTANPLFRIARLAQLFAGSTIELNPEASRLGELFFSLRPSETGYLFDWVNSLSMPARSGGTDETVAQDAFSEACRRLTRQVFLVASQEAARARLQVGTTPEEVVGIAGTLYLESSPAQKVLFFLLDQRRQELVGIAGKGGSRLSRELNIPLNNAASLASRALGTETAISSFGSKQAMTVTDRLLARLCDGQGFVCCPLSYQGQPLALLVFGFACAEDADVLQTPAVKLLHPLVSMALAQVSLGEFYRVGDGTLLLRRVNHEISSPLTIINNYAEVLKHSLAQQGDRELVTAIRQESQRVDEIVRYYLNQQDNYEFPDQQVDINEVIRETVDTLQLTELTARHIAVEFDLQQDLPRLSTMKVLIRQILVNLLTNAAEALGSGGEIRLVSREGCCSDRGRYVEICVADNGPGIPAAIRERLFRPVVSTKGGAHAGAGLSIVKGMVEDLGGRISCHSQADVGSSFYIQLPIVDDFSLFSS